MNKKDWYFIIIAFLVWRVGLFLILLVAVKFIPLQLNFLGGGAGNYLTNPFLWSWANFDGEHYLSIAQHGYGFGEYAFFPLLPLLIKAIGGVLGGSLTSLNIAGNLIVNTSFFLALLGFYKLVRIDFPQRVARLSVILLLLFPTSFYFASIYTESLFLVFAVWSLYFARKSNWFLAAIFGILLCVTRFVGLIILPVIFIEWLTQNWKNKNIVRRLPFITLTVPAGLIGYIYYLKKVVNNPFAFFSELTMFGEQRSNHLITLPQVFYRYIFKILPSLNTTFFPVIFSTIFEFIIGVVFLLISVASFFLTRVSYATFILLGYLIPTFSGSFSSLPRYVLILFPVYIIAAKLLSRSKVLLFAFYALSFILLGVSFALFSRGYWLS